MFLNCNEDAKAKAAKQGGQVSFVLAVNFGVLWTMEMHLCSVTFSTLLELSKFPLGSSWARYI